MKYVIYFNSYTICIFWFGTLPFVSWKSNIYDIQNKEHTPRIEHDVPEQTLPQY